MTAAKTTHTLKVPGASLYYEVRGSGPVLLMIPGGPTDAGIFDSFVPHLTDRYTTVAMDPRGNSRSRFDGAPVDQDMDVHADDAAAVIDAIGQGPALVFGSSGGAQIGLNLAARHPGKVKALVAHEPPCIQMLPDAAEVASGMEEVYGAYAQGGVAPAMAKFHALTGLGDGPAPGDGPPAPPSPNTMEMFGRIGGNMDYFLGHGRPISFYVPPVETLRTGAPRVLIGVGETSGGELAHRAASALAWKLGQDPVVFPGDHGGYSGWPEAFAQVLDKALIA